MAIERARHRHPSALSGAWNPRNPWPPSRSLRPIVAALGAVALLALVPVGALAAGPSTGTVVVTVVDDETHDPVAGATVSLTGFVDGAVDPVYDESATAGSDGSATFASVPRTSGGSAVSVTAEASLAESSDVDGCSISEEWSGGSDPTPVAAETAIAIDASRSESATCEPPGPDAPVLSGLALGADGQPFHVAFATLEMDRQDGGQWSTSLTVGSDGSFSTPVERWGTHGAPARLVVHVIGDVVATETEGDCTYDLAPDGTLERSVELADGGALPEVVVLAELSRVSAVCGTTGTPSPTKAPRPTATAAPTTRPAAGGSAASSTPHPTLPETDVATSGTGDDMVGVSAIVLALIAGEALAAFVVRRLAGRRRS